MHNETIASRLRAARQAAGMSQAAVGAALEPPKPIQEISRYERNGATPNVLTIEQLAAVLNVEPCWLAWGCEHMSNHGIVVAMSSDYPRIQRADALLINEADNVK